MNIEGFCLLFITSVAKLYPSGHIIHAMHVRSPHRYRAPAVLRLLNLIYYLNNVYSDF